MHCNICQRPGTAALPFDCATCARNVLYQSRVSLAHTLLEQEAAVSQVGQYLRGSQVVPPKPLALQTSKSEVQPVCLNLGNSISQSEATRHQTQLATDYAKRLRLEIDGIRREIARGKARNTERRDEILGARKELARRRTLDLGRFEKGIAGIHRRWDTMQVRIAESRLLLCKEAARLYGLKKSGNPAVPSASDTYHIGGLPIYNLKALNSADTVVLTTVTANLAHLVHLVSHYLGLRLPAEVILPHHDCPFPIILAPDSSYIMNMTPDVKAAPDSNTSRAAPFGRGTLHIGQRLVPKVPHMKKRLSTIVKDDPQTYAAAVEGFTLLAWDAAWLCRIQGLDVGGKSWEEVCDAGKNLWKLFELETAVHRPEPAVERHAAKQNGKPDAIVQVPRQRTEITPSIAFGQYSHGTLHSNLSTASGYEILHGWRLQDPTKIIARVKQLLLSDRTGAGWELLEGREWESQMIRSQHPEPDSMVDASTVVIAGRSGGRLVPRHASSDPRNHDVDDGQEKIKSTSGWMKLKSR